MESSSNPSKRKFANDAPPSPPPLKRKVQSTITQNAVASFFAPTSSKPPPAPQKIVWMERAPDDNTTGTLLVGKYQPSNSSSSPKNPVLGEKRRKVAAFDFDSTLIETRSGKKFASDAHDWKWWHLSVPEVLRRLYHEDGYRVVIISNQGGISLTADTKIKAPKANHTTKLASFKTKAAMVLNELDIPTSIYAATEKDIYRKPRAGMWREVLEDYDVHYPGDIDLENSIFVGDAGGRISPKDFSCSDRNFAHNVGITFHTPEEFFLHEVPREFRRSFNPSEYLPDFATAEAPEVYFKKSDQEIVLFCGSPGAGKSTFFKKRLQPLGFERINQDILKTRERCIKAAGEYLEKGKSVAIDNTNPGSDVRSIWVELSKKHKVRIRCVLFTASAELCEHNNAVRALNPTMNPEKRDILPGLAFKGFSSRYQRPAISEGFQDITEVNFKFDGSEAERRIWSQYWN